MKKSLVVLLRQLFQAISSCRTVGSMQRDHPFFIYRVVKKSLVEGGLTKRRLQWSPDLSYVHIYFCFLWENCLVAGAFNDSPAYAIIFYTIVQINNAFETNDAISAQLTPVTMVKNISIERWKLGSVNWGVKENSNSNENHDINNWI